MLHECTAVCAIWQQADSSGCRSMNNEGCPCSAFSRGLPAAPSSLQTQVGSTEQRGISGGERKRLTTAEIIVGQQPVCFMGASCAGAWVGVDVVPVPGCGHAVIAGAHTAPRVGSWGGSWSACTWAVALVNDLSQCVGSPCPCKPTPRLLAGVILHPCLQMRSPLDWTAQPRTRSSRRSGGQDS